MSDRDDKRCPDCGVLWPDHCTCPERDDEALGYSHPLEDDREP